MSRTMIAILCACVVAVLAVAAGANGDGDGKHEPARHAAKPTTQPASFLDHGVFAASLNSLARRLDVDAATLRTAVKAVVREEQTKYGKTHPKPDLATLKAELATSLASKIGKTPDEVLTAVRAELDARLTQAVQAGWLTQKGHDLALACFDTPATCDMKALKGEVRFGHKGSPDQSSGSGSSPAPSGGKMTPGSRATSTPLR
jgi:hypothetical protein